MERAAFFMKTRKVGRMIVYKKLREVMGQENE